MSTLTAQDLEGLGLDAATAGALAAALGSDQPADTCWQRLCRDHLRPSQPFTAHQAIYRLLANRWDEAELGPFPAWLPAANAMERTAVGQLATRRGCADYEALHAWSVEDPAGFWGEVLDRLAIPFVTPAERILDDAGGPQSPAWLPGGRLNVAQSCFLAADDRPAIVFQREGGPLEQWSIAELRALSGRVAAGLIAHGFSPGDAIAIDMPMTPESVAIYLGIVRAGCAAISIADSFSPAEIATRLRIGQAKGAFTQDVQLRGGKRLPLYSKLIEADAPRCVVLPAEGDALSLDLREGDLPWSALLADAPAATDHAGDPDDLTNVLFSSGTTGEPKAIPWTQTTPLKCAADGAFHHDIQAGDVVCWPTNLGWMMGPWLIYAALVNRATIALYCGAPVGPAFCEFVERAGVTMLGVVPSLVSTWREADATAGCDWSAIKCFSSTGECSNAEDMLWLMSRAGYRPVIEYCGGTEIGGGYITGTLVQPAAPATFTTPALGLAFELRDEAGAPSASGEVFLVPPSIGLSQRLLNRDHDEVYHQGAPSGVGGRVLRRHGDRIEALPGGFFRAHGRVDDTMNLGGIKVSSAEIERVVGAHPDVHQAAAIAVPEAGGGPSRLVLYVEGGPEAPLDADTLRADFQARIRANLNPLFKVAEVRVLGRLPRTASNKVMRRELRADYLAERGV